MKFGNLTSDKSEILRLQKHVSVTRNIPISGKPAESSLSERWLVKNAKFADHHVTRCAFSRRARCHRPLLPILRTTCSHAAPAAAHATSGDGVSAPCDDGCAPVPRPVFHRAL